MRRNCLVLMLVVALLVSLTVTAFTAEQVTLRFAWWGSQSRHDKTLKVIELFEKEYPNIKIKPEYTGWDGYFDKMAAQAAGGNLPDLMQHDYKFIKQYVDNNLIIPLDQYVAAGKIDFRDIPASVMTSGYLNGKLYGINLGNNTYAIIYDPEMFAQAGIAEPKPGWTWDDYMAACRQIKNKLGIYADTNIANSGRYAGFEHYLRQHGFKFFGDSGKSLGYTDDKLFVNFYKMDLALVKEKVFSTAEIRIENHTVENDLMVTKKTAMATYWSNQIIAISKAAGRPLKMALYPSIKGQVKEGQYLKPSMFLSITKHSKHPEEAAQFISFFINSVEAGKVLGTDRGVPVANKVRDALKANLSVAETEMFNFVELAAKYSSAIDPPYPASFQEVFDLLTDIHYKMLYEVLTPEAAAKEFRTKANAILAR